MATTATTTPTTTAAHDTTTYNNTNKHHQQQSFGCGVGPSHPASWHTSARDFPPIAWVGGGGALLANLWRPAQPYPRLPARVRHDTSYAWRTDSGRYIITQHMKSPRWTQRNQPTAPLNTISREHVGCLTRSCNTRAAHLNYGCNVWCIVRLLRQVENATFAIVNHASRAATWVGYVCVLWCRLRVRRGNRAQALQVSEASDR